MDHMGKEGREEQGKGKRQKAKGQQVANTETRQKCGFSDN
jgi:hypothetical protein